MSDDDENLKTFYYALTYNASILVVSLTLWILLIRPVRGDKFKPNVKGETRKKRVKVQSTEFVIPEKNQIASMDSTMIAASQDEHHKSAACKLWVKTVSEFSWMRDVWRWEISEFISTDVYLYLLFLKTSAHFFAAVSLVSVLVSFPLIWTATDAATESPVDGTVRTRGFFEKSVIMNVPSTSYSRLWALYAICWVMTGLGLYFSLRFYRSVRSDEFRPAVLQSLRKKSPGAVPLRGGARARRRFMPSKHTVYVMGLERNLLNPDKLRERIAYFVDPSEIVAVHIIPDHSEALKARQVFEHYLSRLLEAQKRHQEVKAGFVGGEWHGEEAAIGETIDLFNQNSGSAGGDLSGRQQTIVVRDGKIISESASSSRKEVFRQARGPSVSSRDASDVSTPGETEPRCRSATCIPASPSVRVKRSRTEKTQIAATRSFVSAGSDDSRTEENSPLQRGSPDYSIRSTSSDDGGEIEITSQQGGTDSSTMGRDSLASVIARTRRFNARQATVFSPSSRKSGWSNRVSSQITSQLLSQMSLQPVDMSSPDRVTISSMSDRPPGPPQINVISPHSEPTNVDDRQQDSLRAESRLLRATSKERAKLRKMEAKLLKLETKVLRQYRILSQLKTRPAMRNVGIAFVSLSRQEAASFMLSHDLDDPQCPVFDSEADDYTVNECPKCHQDRELRKCLCRRWHKGWKIRPAPPPEDIVWENIHIDEWARTIRRVTINLFIFLLSLVLTSSAMLADALVPFALHVESIIQTTFFKMSLSGWLAPMILYVINALVLPLLVAWAADVSRFWRISARERAVLHGNVNFMVLNSLVFPILGTTSIRTFLLFLYETSVSDLFTVTGLLVAGASASFMIRYVLNTVFVNSAMQLLQLPMFSQQRVMVKLHKKPERWNYDFGYWYAFHLSVLAVCVTFCVDLPLVPVLGALFFTAKYWVDKYNMTFNVWRISGESAGAVASSAVSFMLYFQALFLFAMASYFVTVGLRGDTAAADQRSLTSSLNHLREALISSTQAVNRSKRSLLVILPRARQPRGLVIAGFFLLAASIFIIILTVGQKAQRTIVDHHAGTLRRLARFIYQKSRRLAEKVGFNFRRPTEEEIPISDRGNARDCEGICLQRSTDLTLEEKIALSSSYCHPFDRDGAAGAIGK